MKNVPGKNWLHKQGNWYLLSAEQAKFYVEYEFRKSHIWHQCQSPKAKGISGGHDYKGCWRISNKMIDRPCGVCGEVCPDEISGLWRLHNWDHLDAYDY